MTSIIWKSQAEYARHRGCSAVAVKKAIASGRVPAEAVRRSGTSVLIDVAAADLGWPNKLRVDTPLEDSLDASISPSASPSSPAAPKEPPRLMQARTEQAEIDARIKALDYAKRIGKALDADDVSRSMAACAEAIVRDVDQLHARADDLVTTYTRNGIAGVRVLLKDISRGLRETIAANMRLLGAADEPDELAEGEGEGEPADRTPAQFAGMGALA